MNKWYKKFIKIKTINNEFIVKLDIQTPFSMKLFNSFIEKIKSIIDLININYNEIINDDLTKVIWGKKNYADYFF